jgi:hypothetical protein
MVSRNGNTQIKFLMKISLTKKRRSRLWPHSLIPLILTMLIAAVPGEIGGARASEPAAGRAKSSSAMQTQSYEGMVTDTHCGARHSAAIGMAAADCTRVCVHGGEQFALIDGDSVYVLEGDPEALKRVAGRRVRVVGTLNGNKIAVSAVASGE